MQVGPRWKFSSYLYLLVNVEADVEPAVIPVRLVIAAPLAVGFHPVDVTSHLMAVFAVLGSIPIDPRAISFEPLVATFAPVLIRSGRPHGQQQTSGQRGG